MSVDKNEGARPGHLKFAFGDAKLLRSKHMLRQQCIHTACRENLCNVYVEIQGVRLGYKFAFSDVELIRPLHLLPQQYVNSA